MVKYINKSALVAEIDRLQEATMDKNQNFLSSYHEGIFDGLSMLENFLDTLEVKEVDAEKEFENEDLINLHKACEWVRKKIGEEAVVNFCKAMEE